MKKIIISLTLIIMVAVIFVSVNYFYTNSFNVNTVQRITTASNQGVSYSFSTKEDIGYILDSFKDAAAQEVNETDELIVFRAELINKSGKRLQKDLFFDVNNASLYFKDDKSKKTYKVSDDYEKYYFTHEAFESIYIYRIPPEIKMISDNEELSFSLNVNWSHKKMDGNYYSSQKFVEQSGVYTFNSIGDININYTITPLSAEYELYKGSDMLSTGEIQDGVVKIPDNDGNYSLSIISSYDDATKGYKGTIVARVDFNVDLPAEFSIDKNSIYQGDFLRIDVHNLNSDEIPFINQNMFDRFTFYKSEEGKSYGYIPISYNVKKGTYSLSYGINEKETGTFAIDVISRDFNIQYLTVDSTTEQSTRNDKAYEEFDKYFTPRRYESNSSAYFEKPFILPTKGRLSTEYGETRHVNGSPTSYNHSGLDIATPSGTKVIASNDGMIKLSMHLTLTGNTILIDHGSGFFSVYYHMKDRFVKEGEMVKQGQKIGTVGSTGFSTGPHLHFMISYYNQNLEPGYFIYKKPITYANYKDLFR
jgi:murein DD-endopeptidase MepM/ murein hydrolase activator NlpD